MMYVIGFVALLAAPGGVTSKAPGPVKPAAVKIPAIPKVKIPGMRHQGSQTLEAVPSAKRVSTKGKLKPMRSRAFHKLRRRLRHAKDAKSRIRILKRGLKRWHVDFNQSEILLRGFLGERVRIVAFKVIRPKMISKRQGVVGWWTVDGADFRPAQVRRFKGMFKSQDGKSVVDFGGSQFKP